MQSLIHAAFLACTLAIALLPLSLLGQGAGRVWLFWIALWGGLAGLTASGVFVFDPPLLRLAVHFGGQIALGVALFALIAPLRRVVRALPLSALVGFQRMRVIGGFFLIGAIMGEVSWAFALVAGIGDILVGLAAHRTARAMPSGDAPALARGHTLWGLGDFASAIGTAILTQAQIGGPYIMIPLFLVPMAVLTHPCWTAWA